MENYDDLYNFDKKLKQKNLKFKEIKQNESFYEHQLGKNLILDQLYELNNYSSSINDSHESPFVGYEPHQENTLSTSDDYWKFSPLTNLGVEQNEGIAKTYQVKAKCSHEETPSNNEEETTCSHQETSLRDIFDRISSCH